MSTQQEQPGAVTLTTTRWNALKDVSLGYLLDGPELAAAAWLAMKGLIEPTPQNRPDDPVGKRAFYITDAGRRALDRSSA